MRFLHTSDWHLGRLFHGVHLTDDQSYVLEEFIKLAQDSKPDAIIIAGDIYDRAIAPTEAVELLDDTLSRLLLDCKIPVVIISGNHDSPERLGFGNKLLAKQGLHLFGTLGVKTHPVVIPDKYGPVYFVPLSYAEPVLVREVYKLDHIQSHEQAMLAMIDNVLKEVPANSRKVGIAHAFIAGAEESESERPLSVGGSSSVPANIFSDFNYVALGHLHNSQKAGAEYIRYSGSLMKYSFSEVNHKKGVCLVELDGCSKVSTEVIDLKPRRNLRVLEGYFKDILTDRDFHHDLDDYLLVRLKDENPILDAMGRLRSVFPNVLSLERLNLNTQNELRGLRSDHRKLTEVQLFDSFYEQVTGQLLSTDQKSEFLKVMEDLYLQNREAAK
ncbi:MAG: exonuclease SbcCD subunit D [Desulfitobacterium hafniense]|nr:exonuclease SbcCD subunit D [Desulfitobacterium hafniense]